MASKSGKEHKIGMTIGVICMNTLPSKWVEYMENWKSFIPGGLFWQYEFVIGKYYDEARNEVVQRARKNGSKWLFFVDSDVFMPFNILHKLFTHRKPITTGVYWTKSADPTPVIFDTLGNGPIWDIKESDRLIEIGGAGLGCCLIDMEVFDKFDEAELPHFKCDWQHTTNTKKINVSVGEDHWFFIKARELGYKVYCDTTVLCEHYDLNMDMKFPKREVIQDILEYKAQKEAELRDEKKPKIVYYQRHSIPMNGNSIEEGPLGGTETDMINMAREMVKLGCDVEVYCNCNNEGTVDGVKYFNADKFDPVIHADVVIANRDAYIFDEKYSRVNAKLKIIWGHDLGTSQAWDEIENVIDNVDGIIMVSQFHADTLTERFPDLPKEKIFVSRNGVDNKRFNKTVERDRNRLIYTSTPFRGLDILLECFPEIKKQVPEASLDIYSGMKLYGTPELDKDYQALYNKAIQMDDVMYSEPVTQDELAEIHMSAGLLAYPNTFRETFCITAAEAMTARTPIVTSNLGALPETVGDCGILIDIDPIEEREAYKEEFIKSVVKLLTDDKEWNKYHERCKEVDYGWDILANQWLMDFFGQKWKEYTLKEKRKNASENGLIGMQILKKQIILEPHKLSTIMNYIDNIRNGSEVLYIGEDKTWFSKFMSEYRAMCSIETGKEVKRNPEYVVIDRYLDVQKNKEALIHQVKRILVPGGTMFIVTKMDEEELKELIEINNGIMSYEVHNDDIIALVKFRRK